MGQCCAQGGCCRQAPARVIKNRNGGVVRINVLYHGRACFCGPRNGVSEKDVLTCPEEVVAAEQLNRNNLLEAGQYKDEYGGETELRVKQIWKEFFGPQGALMEVQRKHLAVGGFPTCFFRILLLVFTLGFCLITFVQNEKKRVMAWDTDMRTFQRNLNEKIKDLGISVKTQSNCEVTSGNSGKNRHIERWFSFALTPKEVAKLENEPHLLGDIENHDGCGGVNENECCMHPLDCL
eukprot:GEMP01046585.1.p1 GENE.GEMP01046585.1~~GEMP01046585.1.p1  ORF type:complete len:236 (-),score=36.72 GEMP01046585.1:992-1699(-)